MKKVLQLIARSLLLWLMIGGALYSTVCFINWVWEATDEHMGFAIILFIICIVIAVGISDDLTKGKH